MEKGISNKVKKRLKVDSWLCLGCGLCAMNCSQGAISLFLRKSYIDQGKCISCNRCIRICPQGAIHEIVPVSGKKLREEIESLRSRVSGVTSRIEKLRS